MNFGTLSGAPGSLVTPVSIGMEASSRKIAGVLGDMALLVLFLDREFLGDNLIFGEHLLSFGAHAAAQWVFWGLIIILGNPGHDASAWAFDACEDPRVTLESVQDL